MMTQGRGLLAAAAAAAVLWLAGADAALADVIDGNWCGPDDHTFSIKGPSIVTPGGTATTGDYSRHRFAYTVPPSEADAGTPITMFLLNEDTVRLVKGSASPEIWHRCDVTS